MAADTLRFATFELDVRSRELRQADRWVRLQEQPFEVLRTMLERPGEIVTRDELQRRLWPNGTFVDFEHGLNAAVKRLRAALGETAENPRFVGQVVAGRADRCRFARGGSPVVRAGAMCSCARELAETGFEIPTSLRR